jgi:Na+/H+ antiporter NhaA
VSLFIADLAFDSPERVDDARLAILCGSMLAGTLATWRLTTLRSTNAIEEEGDAR